MRHLSRLLVAAALTLPLLAIGCTENQTTYTTAEQPHYLQWEHDTHRDHVDWEKRSNDEHKQYWDWRKSH